MVNRDAVDRAAAVLTSADWFRDAHTRIWAAVLKVQTSGAAVDYLTVRDALAVAGDLETIGGPAYVTALTDGLPTSTNVEHYAGIVRRCRLERDLLTAAGLRDVHAIREAAEALSDLDVAADPASVVPFVALAEAETGSMIPDVMLPGLAWRGSLSVVGGAPKAGKSTLIGQGIAAACTGVTFFGQTITCGLVAMVTEEPVRLTAARLVARGADPNSRCFIAPAGARGVLQALKRLDADLVVIDSFTAFAVAAGAESMNDAAGMRRVLNSLRDIAEKGAAVLLVHHVRKSDGALADSRDIAASADAIIDFYAVDAAGERCAVHQSDRRRLTGIGRWPVDTFTLEYADGEYHGAPGSDDEY